MEKIRGTGQIHEVTFWLNVADRSLRNYHVQLPTIRGSAIVAINKWLNYYSVRTKHVR